MNVRIFNYILGFVFLISLSYSASFNVCGVTIQEPWIDIRSSSSSSSLIIDKNGNMYARGGEYSSQASLQSNVDSVSGGIVVKGDSNVNVGSVNSGGAVTSKGYAIVQGGQAACSTDGNSCNVDGVTREYRDYYCNLLGDKSGICQYTTSSPLNCAALNGGACIDSNTAAIENYGCSSNSCTFAGYSGHTYCSNSNGWVCSSSSAREYRSHYCSGSGSCSSYTITSTQGCPYGCSGGACNTCTAESVSTTCSGKNGEWTTNNCGTSIYCPSSGSYTRATPSCSSYEYCGYGGGTVYGSVTCDYDDCYGSSEPLSTTCPAYTCGSYTRPDPPACDTSCGVSAYTSYGTPVTCDYSSCSGTSTPKSLSCPATGSCGGTWSAGVYWNEAGCGVTDESSAGSSGSCSPLGSSAYYTNSIYVSWDGCTSEEPYVHHIYRQVCE